MNETAQKILGYIKRLPETWDGQPLRQQALDNFDEKFCEAEYNSVNERNFIKYAFDWFIYAPTSYYWDKIYMLIMDGTIQLLPEEKKDEFVWDDNLVMEFALQTKVNGTKDWVCSQIEQFKASKQRKPLFVTEDGVEVFDDITVYRVNGKFDINPIPASKVEEILNGKRKTFAGEAAAIEYVRLNKPMYSLNDVKKTWLEYVGVFNLEIFIEHLQKLKQ